MSSGKPKRVPQSQRNLQVRAELEPNGLGLLLAWMQAKRALDAGTPELVADNPWRPTQPDGNNDARTRDPESLPELTRQIAAVYATGLTQQQVADKFHLHVQTIRRHLRLAGAPTRRRHSLLSDAQLAEAKSVADGGVSLHRLGILLGMSHTTVARLLHDYERRVTPREKPPARSNWADCLSTGNRSGRLSSILTRWRRIGSAAWLSSRVSRRRSRLWMRRSVPRRKQNGQRREHLVKGASCVPTCWPNGLRNSPTKAGHTEGLPGSSEWLTPPCATASSRKEEVARTRQTVVRVVRNSERSAPASREVQRHGWILGSI